MFASTLAVNVSEAFGCKIDPGKFLSGAISGLGPSYYILLFASAVTE